jgi:hypothetical protein
MILSGLATGRERPRESESRAVGRAPGFQPVHAVATEEDCHALCPACRTHRPVSWSRCSQTGHLRLPDDAYILGCSHALGGPSSLRDIHRKGQSRFRTVDDVKAVLDRLVADGRVVRVPETRTGPGPKPDLYGLASRPDDTLTRSISSTCQPVNVPGVVTASVADVGDPVCEQGPWAA